MGNPTRAPDELALTEFPIFQSEWGYRNQASNDRAGYRSKRGGLYKIRELSQAHQDIITSFQPYPGGLHTTANRPLLALHKLRNIDAHQELHIAIIRVKLPKQPLATVRQVSPVVFNIEFSESNEETSTMELVQWQDNTTELTAHVQDQFPTQITFDEPREPLLHGQDILALLNASRNRVADVVERFAPDFPTVMRQT